MNQIPGSTFRKIKKYLVVILMFFLCSANGNPFIRALGIERLLYFIVYGCFLLSLIIHFVIHGDIRIGHIVRMLVVVLMFVFAYLLSSPEFGNRYLHVSGMLTYPIFYETIIRKEYIKKASILLVLFSILICFLTIRGIWEQPYAARMADSSSDLQTQGVGSYIFVYAIVLGSIILVCDLLNNKNSKRLLVSKVVTVILFSFLILKANFVIAIIVMILGYSHAFIFRKIRNGLLKRVFVILLGLLIILFLINPLLSFLSSVLIKILPQTGRLAFLSANNTNNLLKSIIEEFRSDRLPTMQASLDAIRQYPLFGVIASKANFGEHSTILDTFAIWGVPIGLV